jgi:hypothetical protein
MVACRLRLIYIGMWLLRHSPPHDLMETVMRASTKDLLVSAFILGLCGAIHAQGAGGGGAGTGGSVGTAGANGAGQGATGIATPNKNSTTGSTSGTSQSSTVGTSPGNSQPKMNTGTTGTMDTPASASGMKKPY